MPERPRREPGDSLCVLVLTAGIERTVFPGGGSSGQAGALQSKASFLHTSQNVQLVDHLRSGEEE